MHCVWIVTCILFGFSLQADLVLADGLSDCGDHQYKLKGDGANKCRDCPACPAGQMYTQHCGYVQRNGLITKLNKGCKECPRYQYKTKKSTYECQECTYKCPKGTEMIHPCNKTHDLKCSKCKKGFYTARDGSCVRCSPCCGKISIYANKYFEKECEEAGMGQCSCRLLGCVGKNVECKKHLSNISTTNPTRKKSIKPTNSTTTTMTEKSTSDTQQQKDGRKKDENDQSFVTGWLVAIVIGIVLFASILFHVLKHFNILKKIKVLLRPREEETVSSEEYMDDNTPSVITVEERFEAPPRPVNTNYAQRMSPEEEAESQSDHILQRLALLNRTNGSVSDLDHDEYDPWVYRDSIQRSVRMKTIRWPLTRAEVSLTREDGDYIEIIRSEDPSDDCLSTQGNNSGSLLQLNELTSQEMINQPSKTEEREKQKDGMRVRMNDKPGQEHSDNEEPPTSIPATASGENTVVIATGQHRGTMSDELVRNEFLKGKRDKISSNGKRRKPQPENKKSRRKTLDIDSMKSHDILHCTCGDCSYRPYLREQQLCYCTDCVPQPADDLYDIIERRCLRAEICKELNKKGVSNWRELCTYIRIDKDITSIEQEENPANIVLDRLKTSRPRLKLEDFNSILSRIKRQDIMEIIMRHHVKCTLCRRNSFDGSLVDLHKVLDPITSKLSS